MSVDSEHSISESFARQTLLVKRKIRATTRSNKASERLISSAW